MAGMRNMPNQNTAEVKIIKYIPVITLPKASVGQKKLKTIVIWSPSNYYHFTKHK